MAMLSKFRRSVVLILLLLAVSSRPAGAYSVLTHEQIVDMAWNGSIQPLLLRRYPNLTPAQLREARPLSVERHLTAQAYGNAAQVSAFSGSHPASSGGVVAACGSLLRPHPRTDRRHGLERLHSAAPAQTLPQPHACPAPRSPTPQRRAASNCTGLWQCCPSFGVQWFSSCFFWRCRRGLRELTPSSPTNRSSTWPGTA